MRRNMTRTVAIAVFALAGSAMGQLITNGDFETGTLSGWTVANTENGVGAPGSVVTVDIDGPGPLNPSQAATFMVGQAVFASGVQEGIEMSQQIPLQAGVTYTFDMDWSAQRLSTSNNSQGGVFTVIVDGNQIAQQAAGTVSASVPKYGHINAQYTPAASGTATLVIRITRPFMSPGDLSQYVDNITLTGPATGGCYANCDQSTTAPVLNVADFSCFLSKFAAQDPYANCDQATTAPVLNVADFSCFLSKFAAGCP